MTQREPTEKEKRIINRLALEEYRREAGPFGRMRRGIGHEKPLEEFRFPYPEADIETQESEGIDRKSPNELIFDFVGGGRCKICGSTKELEKHHIIPLEKGGPDTMENLVILCRECHVKTF